MSASYIPSQLGELSGTITTASVSDFAEGVDDRVNALVVAGAGITKTYNDASGTLTIAATGGGGGGLAVGAPITGGGTGRVLYQDASGNLAESADFAYGVAGVALAVNTGASSTKGLVVKGGPTATRTITDVSLAGNHATLTTSGPHGFAVRQRVTVAGLAGANAVLNGTYTIDHIPTATAFRFPKTNPDIAPAAASGTAVGGQAANLQEWRDSDDTLITSIAKDGVISSRGGFDLTGRLSSRMVGDVDYIDAILDFRPVADGSGWSYINFYNSTTGLNDGIASSPYGQLYVTFASFLSFKLKSGAEVFTSSTTFALRVTPPTASAPGVLVKGSAAQSANLQEWQSSADVVHGTVSENGYFTTRKTSAPADAELVAGEAAFWLDQTPGTSKFMVKAKNSAGTVVSGSIPLS